MISKTEIKRIFDTLPKDTPYTVDELKNIIKPYVDPADLDIPYTTTRPNSNYKMWEHRIQSSLEDYKKNGKAIHYPETTSYSFL